MNGVLLMMQLILALCRYVCDGKTGQVSLEKQWSKHEIPVCYQTIVKVSGNWAYGHPGSDVMAMG